MKKLFTLTAAGALALGSLSAQAQVTVDGVLNAAEISTSNYRLIGKFTNARGFGDWGLLSLYAANSGTKLYFFIGGSIENNGNSMQLYLDLPGVTGAAAGTALPFGSATTSFEKMNAKLDLSADLALALRSDGSGWQVEGAVYTSPTAGSSRKLTSTAGTVPGSGAPLTLPATTTVGAGFSRLAGAVVAYKAPTGNITTNPGNTVPNTGASYGAAGSYGWEIELDRAALGVAANPSLINIFALMNNGSGGFLSSDFIPQNTAAVTATGYPLPNLGGPDNNGGTGNTGGPVDFGVVPGTQSAAIQLTATGLLGNKAAEAAVALNVFPNPANGVATIAYSVASRPEPVRVVLTDLMGRSLRVLENATKATGPQSLSLSTADVAAGTYLVRVQVGETVVTRKVVLL
jgi:hypothetical protein